MALPVAKVIEIPDMNPIRFVKDNHEYARYQTLNSQWFRNQEEYWNVKANYYQKKTFDDFIGVQLFAGGKYLNAVSSFKLQLLNCKGRVISEVAPSHISILSGNVYNVNDTDLTMRTANFTTSMRNMGAVSENIYFLRIKTAYLNGELLEHEYYTSEPILVREDHPGTKLLEYISYTNKLNVHYSSGIFYHLRVEGEVLYTQPENNSIQYDDQKMNPKLQSAEPYRGITLKMGYPYGLPMWMYDKVNRAFDNDYVLCDKVRYTRGINAEIEIDSNTPRYQMFGGSLAIREADNVAQSVNITSGGFTLFTASFPYMAYKIMFSNSGTGQSVDAFTGFEVNNLTDQETFVNNVLNTWSVPNKGLNGRFRSIPSGGIVYENGLGEFFDTSECIILTKSFTLRYAKHPSTLIDPKIWMSTTRVAFAYKGIGEVFCYGDGVNTIVAHPTFNYTSADSAANIRVWHDDSITSININETGNPSTLVRIDYGAIPANLQGFQLYGCAMVGKLDMIGFPTSLTQLAIQGSSLFFTGLSNFNKAWVNLKNINISQNLLTSAEVDSILNQHYNANSYDYPLNGVFRVSLNTPAAPPTAASAAARAKLAARGWTLYSD